jgi:hypothetical protein
LTASGTRVETSEQSRKTEEKKKKRKKNPRAFNPFCLLRMRDFLVFMDDESDKEWPTYDFSQHTCQDPDKIYHISEEEFELLKLSDSKIVGDPKYVYMLSATDIEWDLVKFRCTFDNVSHQFEMSRTAALKEIYVKIRSLWPNVASYDLYAEGKVVKNVEDKDIEAGLGFLNRPVELKIVLQNPPTAPASDRPVKLKTSARKSAGEMRAVVI